MRLIPMQPGHLSAAAELEKRCFSCPWSYQMLASELENRCARYVAAEEDGVLIGYIGMYVVKDQGFLSNLAVSPDFRRRGVGSALLAEQIGYAREKGVREVMLEVRESNAGAIALYERFGFERKGRRPRYYERPTEDAILMNLSLPEEKR